MTHDDFTRYVVKHPTSGIYRYYRRTPVEVAHLDKRSHVRQSLKTKSLKDALGRAEVIHGALEDLWRAMLAGRSSESAIEQYEAAVKAAQSLGFVYRPAAEAAKLPLEEIDRRISIAQENVGKSETVLHAALGTAPDPAPHVSDIWHLYAEHNAAGFKGMSPNQYRKHKISRERAIRYLQERIGDPELGRITRTDVLDFRSWWIGKISRESLKAYSANRCFSDLAGMMSVIDMALQTSYGAVWREIRIKATNATKLGKRSPFATDYIAETILAEDALGCLNDDGRRVVLIMIETGMRLGEVCNLRPEDIHLEDEVPHVEIAEREDRQQKTAYSIRRVPLVGVALWAMRQSPDGFPKFHDKADVASDHINKAMRTAGLRPTARHTAYSFRHSFQDRIENAGASDRMQADLMGHEFGRPRYGDGPEMKRRQALLERIRFRPPWLPAEFQTEDIEPPGVDSHEL